MSEPYIGQIKMFAGTFAPRSYAFCDGQLLAISQNDALFSLLGTLYGGDGETTFGLPDLRGRVPIHQGSGPGLSPRTLGSNGGAESVTLNAANLAHNHTMRASDDPATESNPAGNVTAADLAIDAYHTAPAPTAGMAGTGIGSVGGGQAHNNMAPYLAINYIIALFGVYPSQS